MAAEPSAEIQRLEKAGARVTVDEALPENARLRVSFTSLDDKAAVALRGATHVGGLVVEDASRLTDRSMAVIGTLTNLRELNLGRPAITNSGMTYLKNLKELRKLYLIDAAKVYDSGVAHLKSLEDLEELDLTGSAITNAAASTLKTMPNLKLLAVLKTKFSDIGALQLKGMSGLKKLEAEVSVKTAMELEGAIPGIGIRR
jgi:Leucine-rich repeat (LRR) protein